MSTIPPEVPPGAAAPAPAQKKPRQSSGRILVRNVLSNWTGLVLNMAVAFFMSPFLVAAWATSGTACGC